MKVFARVFDRPIAIEYILSGSKKGGGAHGDESHGRDDRRQLVLVQDIRHG
jgi:hypothetical protein